MWQQCWDREINSIHTQYNVVSWDCEENGEEQEGAGHNVKVTS